MAQQVLTEIQAQSRPRGLGSQLLQLGAPGRKGPFHFGIEERRTFEGRFGLEMIGFTGNGLLDRRLEASSVLILPIGGLTAHHHAQGGKSGDSEWTE